MGCRICKNLSGSNWPRLCVAFRKHKFNKKTCFMKPLWRVCGMCFLLCGSLFCSLCYEYFSTIFNSYVWPLERRKRAQMIIVKKEREGDIIYLFTSFLHLPILLLLHPPVSLSSQQKYIYWDTLALNFLPAAVSNTLLNYRTVNIYDKWSQQTRFWFITLSKHTVFTLGNQSINLSLDHVQINSLIQIPSGARQLTHE